MEIDDEELERRMRAKLFGSASGLSGGLTPRLSEADKRIAEKLMGPDNARRIANAKDGQRVRLTAVRVWYEWYEFKQAGFPNGWKIERLTNGKREIEAEGIDREELWQRLSRLRNAGHTIKRVQIGFEKDEDKPPASKPSRQPIAKGKNAAEWLWSWTS